MSGAVRSSAARSRRRIGVRTLDGTADDARNGARDGSGGGEGRLDVTRSGAGRRPTRSSGDASRPDAPANRLRRTPKARGDRTRRRIADSLIELIEEGNPSSTAREVAARTGVSVRLVFHHFEDMDALHQMVVEVQAATHWANVRELAPDLPLSQRVERTVRQRARLYDAVGPVRRAETALAHSRREVAQALARSDLVLRDWLETTFGPELDAAGRDRRDLLDAMDVAASWETWDRLRRHQHLSAAAARRVVARTLSSLMP